MRIVDRHVVASAEPVADHRIVNVAANGVVHRHGVGTQTAELLGLQVGAGQRFAVGRSRRVIAGLTGFTLSAVAVWIAGARRRAIRAIVGDQVKIAVLARRQVRANAGERQQSGCFGGQGVSSRADRYGQAGRKRNLAQQLNRETARHAILLEVTLSPFPGIGACMHDDAAKQTNSWFVSTGPLDDMQ